MVKKIVKGKGGFFTSKNIPANANEKVGVNCGKGHVWPVSFGKLKMGRWCPYCSGHKGKDENWLKGIAAKKNGECLSRKYRGVHDFYEWKCHNGHAWSATAANINRGHWCPHCNKYFAEKVCRAAMELAFKSKFRKIRPKWLPYDYGFLELDGYSKELNIAFEHQGKQHSDYNKHFHRGGKEYFVRQKQRDIAKKKILKKLGIILYEFHDVPNKTKIEHLGLSINKQFRKFGGPRPRKIDTNNFDLKLIYKTTELNEMASIANSRGGKCISSAYLGSNYPLNFVCEIGHRFKAAPSNIKQGKWCRICGIKAAGIRRRKPVEEYENIIKMFGGKLLGVVGFDRDLKIICENGHTWISKRSNLLNLKWCRKCIAIENGSMKKFRTYSAAKNIVAMHIGAKIIDKAGDFFSGKITIQCEKGHVWHPFVTAVTGGKWCLKCSQQKVATNRRLDIKLMTDYAKKCGGMLISKEYINARISLTWRCQKNHIFKMTPSSARNGRWCRKCRNAEAQSKRRVGIGPCKKLAKAKGGKFLDKIYISSLFKHLWECAEGHRWLAAHNKIQGGSWCRMCSGRQPTKIRLPLNSFLDLGDNNKII